MKVFLLPISMEPTSSESKVNDDVDWKAGGMAGLKPPGL